MLKLISLLVILFLFTGCVQKMYHSPEIDALVVDIETMEPVENIRVLDMQKVGIIKNKMHSSKKSLSDKNGCIHIRENTTVSFNLVPQYGISRTDSKLKLQNKTYQYDDVIIKSLSKTEYANYIFAVCKKTSTKCIPRKWIYLNYQNIFEYDNDVNTYKRVNIYDSQIYDKEKRRNPKLINLPKDKALKCFKQYKKEK